MSNLPLFETKKPKANGQFNAIQIVELLRHRHPAPEWATFSELHHGTGSYLGGRFDFFAFNVWPSTGYLRVVYEIKVSRNDFAKELCSPLKRREAELYANECYFAMPAGLVKVDELPEGWGLIEATSGGLRVKKRAMQRKVDMLPISFVAALARRISDPPSVLPDIFWKFVGQELSVEQVIQASKETIEHLREDIRYKTKQELTSSEDYRTLIGLQNVIRGEVSYEVSIDPNKLQEWFDQKTTAKLDKMTRIALSQLRERLNEILDKGKI